MKHLVLRLTIALLAFSAGLGFDRLLTTKPKPVEKTPPILAYEPPIFVPSSPPVLPVVPIAVLAATPRIIRDYDTDRFSPVAALYTISQKPKVFGDHDLYLDIVPAENNEISMVISGLDGSESTTTEFALITEKRLFFMTSETSDGFEYRFDGEFLRRGVLNDAPEGKAVLKGALTRSRNGRTVATWVLRFAVLYDAC